MEGLVQQDVGAAFMKKRASKSLLEVTPGRLCAVRSGRYRSMRTPAEGIMGSMLSSVTDVWPVFVL